MDKQLLITPTNFGNTIVFNESTGKWEAVTSIKVDATLKYNEETGTYGLNILNLPIDTNYFKVTDDGGLSLSDDLIRELLTNITFDKSRNVLVLHNLDTSKSDVNVAALKEVSVREQDFKGNGTSSSPLEIKLHPYHLNHSNNGVETHTTTYWFGSNGNLNTMLLHSDDGSEPVNDTRSRDARLHAGYIRLLAMNSGSEPDNCKKILQVANVPSEISVENITRLVIDVFNPETWFTKGKEGNKGVRGATQDLRIIYNDGTQRLLTRAVNGYYAQKPEWAESLEGHLGSLVIMYAATSHDWTQWVIIK